MYNVVRLNSFIIKIQRYIQIVLIFIIYLIIHFLISLAFIQVLCSPLDKYFISVSSYDFILIYFYYCKHFCRPIGRNSLFYAKSHVASCLIFYF